MADDRSQRWMDTKATSDSYLAWTEEQSTAINVHSFGDTAEELSAATVASAHLVGYWW